MRKNEGKPCISDDSSISCTKKLSQGVKIGRINFVMLTKILKKNHWNRIHTVNLVIRSGTDESFVKIDVVITLNSRDMQNCC